MRLPPLVWVYWPICGISWTFDWTWRANSWSTRSRSARIGSKICDRAGNDFSTARGKTLSRPEQRVEGGGGARGKVGGRGPAHLGQRRDDARDVGRLVAFPAVRHGGEEGAVGLCQQPLHRNALNGLAQRLGFRERDDAGDGDEEAEREPRVGERRPAGEAAHDA